MGLQQNRKAACTILANIVALVFFVSFLSQRFVLEPFQTIAAAHASGSKWGSKLKSSPSPADSQEGPARALIDSIKETTRLVSGASTDGDDLTAEEREAWNRQNPCLSRAELIPTYDGRKNAQKLPPNPLWDELLVEYSKLHRTCTKKVGNLTDYFLTGNVTTGCKFVVSNAPSDAGLGNKFLTTVSSLLYAILTKRVFLVVSTTLVPYVTCEPFMGSSWLLDSSTFPVHHFSSDFENASATLDQDFFELIDERIKHMNQSTQRFEGTISPRTVPWDGVYAVREKDNNTQPLSRFYCSAEQAFFSEVTWISLSSYFYSIPRLFAAPPFRPTLEALFPDKMATTWLFRSVFLPNDVVWDRVLSIYNAYIDGGDRTVGIQLRYAGEHGQYKKMNDLNNERIVDCTQRNGILPDLGAASNRTHSSLLSPKAKTKSNPVVKVFIACLFTGLNDHLSKRFLNSSTSTGEDIALIQISHNYIQWFNSVHEDKQALAEVILLSLSDQLLVTSSSTFGGLAQAYGALRPWFIEIREDKELPSCERGQTADVCNMVTDKTYRCSYDPAVSEKPIFDLVPYMKNCLSIDEPYGMQMSTNFES